MSAQCTCLSEAIFIGQPTRYARSIAIRIARIMCHRVRKVVCIDRPIRYCRSYNNTYWPKNIPSILSSNMYWLINVSPLHGSNMHWSTNISSRIGSNMYWLYQHAPELNMITIRIENHIVLSQGVIVLILSHYGFTLLTIERGSI